MQLQTNIRKQNKSIAFNGVLITLAMILSYLELLIPLPLGIPGFKLGLANIIAVFALYTQGPKTAITISLLRIILVSAMFGSMSMAFYSISGSLFSLVIMISLKKTDYFSMVGVSMAGGAFHNIGQLIVAILVIENINVLVYFPALLIVGMITGILIGFVTYEILHRIF